MGQSEVSVTALTAEVLYREGRARVDGLDGKEFVRLGRYPTMKGGTSLSYTILGVGAFIILLAVFLLLVMMVDSKQNPLEDKISLSLLILALVVIWAIYHWLL